MVFTILLLRPEAKWIQRSRQAETHRILYNSWFRSENLPLPWLSSSHDIALAGAAGEIPWLRVPKALPHSLFELKTCKVFRKTYLQTTLRPPQPYPETARNSYIEEGLKYRGCICISAAAWLLRLPPTLLRSLSTALTGNSTLLSEMRIIRSMLLHLPSHRLECMKPFRLASASTPVISSPITSFLPLLPVQQHHYWKLRIYSSRFENMSSLSLTSIPTPFEQQPTSCYLLIHLMKEPFALISSVRVNWACVWTVLSLDPHFLTSNILLCSPVLSLILYITAVLQSRITTLQERVFFLESDDPPR